MQRDESAGLAHQPEPILVSINEAAAMVRVSRATFYKLLNNGTVSAVKSGNRTLVPMQALRDYVATLRPYEPSRMAAGQLRGDETTSARRRGPTS